MCRWAAYLGPELFLEDIVTAPCHSLIAQSHHALEAKSATNGDGFGIAWYGERPEPGLYRDILPAWSDPNLKSVCKQIRSKLFLAHVRASTGGATSRANCHPFAAGRWSFMHNGQIGSFERLRRSLEAACRTPSTSRRRAPPISSCCSCCWRRVSTQIRAGRCRGWCAGFCRRPRPRAWRRSG
jgi:predicted glutamine amidotransferase